MGRRGGSEVRGRRGRGKQGVRNKEMGYVEGIRKVRGEELWLPGFEEERR